MHTPHYKGAAATPVLTTAPSTVAKAYFLLIKEKLAIYTCASSESGMISISKGLVCVLVLSCPLAL